MPTLRWLGPGTFTDHGRDFQAVPGEHDVSEEQADEYLDHPQHGDRWERADGADDDAEESDDDADATEAPDEDSDTDDVEAPFDPAEETNDSLETTLDEGDYSAAELKALLEAEKAGDDREGAKSALQDALDDAEE